MNTVACECRVKIDLPVRMTLEEVKALAKIGRDGGITSDRISKEAQDLEIAQMMTSLLIKEFLKK